MSEKITFKELVELIAKQSEQSQSSANSFISELVELIESGLKSDGQVSISGFGKFELRWMKERTGTNPQTGEQIMIPGQNKVVFKPFKALREGVNAPYAHLETSVIDPNGTASKEPSKPAEAQSKEIKASIISPAGSKESIDDLVIERDHPLRKEEKVSEPAMAGTGAGTAAASTATVASAVKPNPKIVKEVQDKGTFNWSFAAAGIIALLAFLLLFYIIQRTPDTNQTQVTEQVESPLSPIEESTVQPSGESEEVDEIPIQETQSVQNGEFDLETVMVAPGQSLWSIADAELGNPYLWPLLYHLNQDLIDNPNQIPVNANLQVPVISNPDDLNEFERDQVARGYLSLYQWNRENNPDEARFFLWAVGVFSTDLLENLPSEVDAEDLAFAVSR